MTIYVDEMQNYGNSGNWCHLWSDTLDDAELDEFAQRIGLKPEWFQVSHGLILKDFPHYDLTVTKRNLALQQGAVKMSLRFWLKLRINTTP